MSFLHVRALTGGDKEQHWTGQERRQVDTRPEEIKSGENWSIRLSDCPTQGDLCSQAKYGQESNIKDMQ